MKTVLLMAWMSFCSALAADFSWIVPHVNSEDGEKTLLVVINPDQDAQLVAWNGYSADGELAGDGEFVLEGNHRTELMFAQSADPTIAWIALNSDGELMVLAESQRPETRTAFWASTGASELIDIPHLAKDTELFETTISVVNVTDEQVQIMLIPQPTGESITLDVSDARGQLMTTSAALFGTNSDLVDWAYLETQAPSIAAMERFTFLPQRDRMAALGLDFKSSDRLIFVHVAEDVEQFWTGMVLVNTGADVLDVTIEYYSNDVNSLERDLVSMAPSSKRNVLFDADHREPMGTAWIDVKANRPDLIGYELFGSAHASSHRFFAGLAPCTLPGKQLIFPVVSSSMDQWTGLVTVNLGSTSADIVFEAVNDSGVVLGRYVEEEVGPRKKIVNTVVGMFGEEVSTAATWVRAVSDVGSWVGACLWGDLGNPRKHLSGVVAKTSPKLYFPPLDSTQWETIAPEDLGWNTELIPELLTFLERQHTRAFIVLKDGRIALEHYALTDLSGAAFDETSSWYWASAGKTLTATLVGVAQEWGFLDIDHPSSDYLGEGWTSMDSRAEADITVRHQLTMTTGLNDHVEDSDCTSPECLVYLADPGTRWAYHNAPYTKLDGIIEGATGTDFDTYFNTQLRDPIGMDGAWFYLDYNHVYFSTPRSMARFGLLILNNGIWSGTAILDDPDYIRDMTQTSQDLNLSYGYLWWLNGKASFMLPGLQYVFSGSLTPHAPHDMFAAIGKNGQLINVVPSQNLLVIRMGDNPDDSAVSIAFQDELWARLSEIMKSAL